MTVLLALFAGPITRELAATARQTLDTKAYVRAVNPAPLALSRSEPK